METKLSAKRRFEPELHGAKSQKASIKAGMLRRVPVVRTDVSEELNGSIIRMTRIGELGRTFAVTKRRFLEEPHGLTSQKTAFFIVTAVKT
jgi:hypothetical protein